MDFVDETARFRNQAEVLRAKSELTTDQETRSRYTRMAEAYDTMADNLERVRSVSRATEPGPPG